MIIKTLNKTQIIDLLNNTDTKFLYEEANKIRKENLGDEIYLRGIIEFSNYCQKNCAYCGIRKENKNPERYRILPAEIIEICKNLEKFKQTTVVLQSGEDPYFTKKVIGDLISKIKETTKLAITLSIGVRTFEELKFWQKKGLDRYLIRFETSNPALFKQVHPDDNLEKRLNCIYDLKKLGIQAGSGFLIGLPNETIEELADDILFCTKLNLAMIGVGPFIPHPNTPLGQKKNPFAAEIFFKTLAVLRILNPKAHIPATTAYDAIEPNGRNKALCLGANIFMPNSTPQKYRKNYLLYPGKPCVDENATDCAACVLLRINALNRKVGTGPGHYCVT